MFNKKKGQAALEFLTTYGWAFLVILVMIAALAYFGVLDPSNMVGESCAASAPISCSGVQSDLSDNDLGVELKNGNPKTMTITGQTLIVEGNDCGAVTLSSATLNSGQKAIITVDPAAANTCITSHSAGDKVKYELALTYTTPASTIPKRSVVQGTVEILALVFKAFAILE
jgi:hypothetical protein